MSKCVLIWRHAVAMIGLASAGMALAAAPPEIWTLERSIRQVLNVAPEAHTARAEIAARQGALAQSGAWPNPAIEVRADNRLGKNDGTGGNALSQLVFSQPLPLSGRLGHQRAIAGEDLNAAQAERHYQQLLLETQTAQRFHALQLATAQLRLAEQRLQLADDLQQTGRRREQAGDMATLERLRLDLIRESAQQTLDHAEGTFSEALSQFRAYAGLSAETIPEVAPLELFNPLPVLETLEAGLPRHPALLAAQHRLKASRSAVALARAERLPDPVVSLFRERDFLNERREDISGIGVAVTLPLWDRNSGRIRESRAQAEQAQFKIQALERDLASRLKQSHLHLSHLVEQGKHHRSRVFEPARAVFDLTRKAYAAGELEILSLIDANNTYFDAHVRHLELLQEAWLEAAELRLAAGQALVTTESNTAQDAKP